jgi:hypothetical protein
MKTSVFKKISIVIWVLFLFSCYSSLNLKTEIEKGRFKNIETGEKLKSSTYSLHEMKELNYFSPNAILNKEKKEQCNKINCSEPFGKCSDTFTCQCNPGYVHAPYITKQSRQLCHYHQRSQLISFLLEFIFLCGAGHFYSMRLMTGFLKFMFSYITYFLFEFIGKEDHPENIEHNTSIKKGCLVYFSYFMIVAFFLTHFYDIMMMGQNKYLDGYGIPMEKFKL